MKIKEGFILKEIAGSTVVVPTGAAMVDFKMMLSLNETGKFLWECLEKGATKEELVKSLLNEYNVDEKTAASDVTEFLAVLESKKVLI